MDKLAQMFAGNRAALASVITAIENDLEGSAEMMKRIDANSGHAHIVGVTGPPGAGKSSFINLLVSNFLDLGDRCGIVAVDPSSPFTGGALLGDRIRMKTHILDKRVFMRSMGSRGNLGGLSHRTRHVAKAMDAFGFDKVIIETVGVGQSEVEISSMADTVLVLLAPGFGDDIQALKAGILEIADIFVVNKSDNPAASKLALELEQTVMMTPQRSSWKIPVLKVSALNNEGISEVASAISAHMEFLKGDEGKARKHERMKKELNSILLELLCRKAEAAIGEMGGIDHLLELSKYRKCSLSDLAEEILNRAAIK